MKAGQRHQQKRPDAKGEKQQDTTMEVCARHIKLSGQNSEARNSRRIRSRSASGDEIDESSPNEPLASDYCLLPSASPTPVCPNPPWPRLVSSSCSHSTISTTGTGAISICAIRIPR